MDKGRRLIVHLDFYRDEEQETVDEESVYYDVDRGIEKYGHCISDYCWVDIPVEETDDTVGELKPELKEVPPRALNFPGPYNRYVLEMMKNWWDMTIDNDWDDLLLAHFNRDIMGFTRFFVEATSEVFDKEPSVRIQFKVVMQQIEVCYDTESEVGFKRATTAFNEMWLKHIVPLF